MNKPVVVPSAELVSVSVETSTGATVRQCLWPVYPNNCAMLNMRGWYDVETHCSVGFHVEPYTSRPLLAVSFGLRFNKNLRGCVLTISSWMNDIW